VSGEVVDGELVDPIDMLAQRQAELEDVQADLTRATMQLHDTWRAYVAWRWDQGANQTMQANRRELWRTAAHEHVIAEDAYCQALDAFVAAMYAAADAR
jgi:hypothetical protein